MRLFVCWRFLLNTGSSLKFFLNNSHQKFNSWWVLNFINKNERLEVQLHNDIKTQKYRCSSWDQCCLPTMQKPLQKVALFNHKLRGTLPRHDAKDQLTPWPGQHIGISGTSSINLFSNYTLIPCTMAPSESTTSFHQLSYTWLPIWSCSIAGTAQHSIKPILKEIPFRNPFKIFPN